MANELFIDDLCQKLTYTLLLEGYYIIQQGEIGKEMYFIKSGTVEVVDETGEIVYATLTEGQFFGAVALTSKDSRRTASIRGATRCELFCLTQDDFDHILHKYPGILTAITEISEQRKNDTQKKKALKKNPNLPKIEVSVEKEDNIVEDKEEENDENEAIHDESIDEIVDDEEENIESPEETDEVLPDSDSRTNLLIKEESEHIQPFLEDSQFSDIKSIHSEGSTTSTATNLAGDLELDELPFETIDPTVDSTLKPTENAEKYKVELNRVSPKNMDKPTLQQTKVMKPKDSDTESSKTETSDTEVSEGEEEYEKMKLLKTIVTSESPKSEKIVDFSTQQVRNVKPMKPKSSIIQQPVTSSGNDLSTHALSDFFKASSFFESLPNSTSVNVPSSTTQQPDDPHSDTETDT
eukprot:CAMPEP_0117433750 /NCGR_PEP_ID=MMETSP0758-20121206/13043_1 /TAXON_ID=63605 /ORGANISM="Percolomonas cosmopolitus, Strain AE-1 (ATCC 50343)" /LENGTH=408 /DNA_ID=CAMNT_0005224589 /DNA_START=247 /DNA_END=1470 /DNA_ORIENTATION=-